MGELGGLGQCVQPAGEGRRQHATQLGSGALSRGHRRRPHGPASGDQSQQHGHGLLIGEHQGRHAVAGREPVAAVATAHRVDRNVEVDQVGDVATDGALVDAQPAGELGDGAGATRLQDLQQGEHSSSRPRHGFSIPHTGRKLSTTAPNVLSMTTTDTPASTDPRLDPPDHRRRLPTGQLLRAGHRRPGLLVDARLRRTAHPSGHAGDRQHPHGRPVRRRRGPRRGQPHRDHRVPR